MPTEHYHRALELTQRHHGRSKTFSGRFLFRYAERLKGAIDEFGCKTMLDYGCQLPDAKVLTPTGWRAIGDLRAGDAVIGSSGLATEVTGTHSPGIVPVFRVKFNDRTSVVVDGNHLWAVRTINHQNRGQPFIVKPTKELASDLKWGSQESNKWRIPVLEAPVEFAARGACHINPYLLGLLLGDGNITNRPILHTVRDDIILIVKDIVPANMVVREIQHDGTGRAFAINQPGGNRWNENPIKRELKRLGLFGCRGWEKFIPDNYLYASVEERIALLQGLIDTDGEVTDRRLSYSTASKRLADDIEFLVQSLGGTVRRKIRQPHRYLPDGSKRPGRPSHQLGIQIPPSIRPTRVKPWRVRKSYHPNRVMVAIEEAGTAAVVGISVAAQDNLYVTEKCIVTHNCGKGIQYRTPMEDGRMLEDYLGVQVTKYDPGWPEFAAEPKGVFDVVVCTQVLGSIPITDQKWVIDRLYGFARKAVFVGERLGPVKKAIHSEMQDLMPHQWSHEKWAAAILIPHHKFPPAVFLRTLNGGGIKGKFERLA